MYLVLDSWKRTNQKLSPTERLGETLKEAGVSMAFAAITDMISFGLGIISNIPAVSLFCLFTTVAVAFDFGYQLTFYLSVVSLSGTRESLGFNSCCCCLKSGEKHEARTKLHKKSKGDLNTLKYLQERGFTGMYSDLLNSPFGKLTLLTSFLVYLTIAILGCCAIRAHISPIKFVLNTSPYKRYWDVGEQFYFGQGFLVEFLISSPPDLRDKNAVSSLFSAISDLESTPFSVGRDSTVFWLRDFIDYIDKVVTFDPYTVLNEWLNIAAFGGWKSQLQVDEVNGTILGVTKTHFFTGFKGVSHWNSKLELLQMIRNITRNYPKLNITGFHPDFLFIDLLGSLPDSIAQV